METNLCVCFLAFDCFYEINSRQRAVKYDYYTDSAKKTILKLKNHNINNIMIMTNKPEKFEGLDIDVIEYRPTKYSFADKLTVCYEALKKYDTIIYMDSDCEIKYEKIKDLNIDEGISIFENWGDGCDIFSENFYTFQSKIEVKTNYFENIIDYCIKNNLNYNEAYLIDEKLFSIKKTDKLDDFFKIYFKLKPIIEENDESFKNHPIGRGEGLALGISIINSGIKYNGISQKLKELELKHTSYYDYIKNNIKVIFVNWTKPFFHKQDAQGYNKLKMFDLPEDEYDVVDYELLIQEVAVRRAKKHIGKTKLYTDLVGYNFYKKKNMLDLWDEIDVEVLENFNQNHSHVNPGRFWTTGKSIVMGQEPVPYLFLDLDFIVRSDLPKWLWDCDLVHTQWEIQRGEFFVFKHQVDDIGGIEDFEQNMMVPNTSFIFMNDIKIRDEYLKKHLDIINRKYDYIPEWLWLIADQGIMGYTLRKFNSKVQTIENRLYLSYPELPVEKSEVGKGLFWVKDPNRVDHVENLEYEHVWFGKHAFKTNETYREMRMEELKSELETLKRLKYKLI